MVMLIIEEAAKILGAPKLILVTLAHIGGCLYHIAKPVGLAVINLAQSPCRSG